MAIQKQGEKQGNGGRGEQAITVEQRQGQQQMSRQNQNQNMTRAARMRPFSMMRRMLDDLDSMGAYGMISPFSSMRRMFEEMERLVDTEVSSDIDLSGRDVVWAPRIEVMQRDDKILVRADVPGVPREQIQVNTEGDSLIIEGERELTSNQQDEDVLCSECVRGYFRRVIALPQGAELDKTEAHYDNGVLEVSVPYAAARSRGRQVQIQSRGNQPQQQASPQINQPAAQQQQAPQSTKH